MKKVIIIFMIVLGIFVVGNISSAGEGGLKAYYNDYLSMKIRNCSQTAALFNTCYNLRMYELIKMRAAQAEFYEENRKELIEMMLSNGIGRKAHKIDYFLITRFKAHKQMPQKRASGY